MFASDGYLVSKPILTDFSKILFESIVSYRNTTLTLFQNRTWLPEAPKNVLVWLSEKDWENNSLLLFSSNFITENNVFAFN